MRILVWQWGRFGAGPRVAADFAALFNSLPGTDAALSLAARAEILASPTRPRCELPVPTYQSVAGYAARVLRSPLFVPWLARRIAALQPAVALCAMPGPLDLAMDAALRRIGVPYAVVVHDADLHPGDGYPLQMALQRRLLRRADAIVVLSDHVRARLDTLGLTTGKPILKTSLPPHTLESAPPPRAPTAASCACSASAACCPTRGWTSWPTPWPCSCPARTSKSAWWAPAPKAAP